MEKPPCCPNCGWEAADVRETERGGRTGRCRNPRCKLNEDGVGFVLEVNAGPGQTAVVAMSFPTTGPRLQELREIIEGKAPPPKARDSSMSFFDGSIWCHECGSPLLTDGEGHIRHVQEIPRGRLRVLVREPKVADQIQEWLGGLVLECPECGEKANPFRAMHRELFRSHVATRRGVRDLFLLIRGLFQHLPDHPAVVEAERIIREGGDEAQRP